MVRLLSVSLLLVCVSSLVCGLFAEITAASSSPSADADAQVYEQMQQHVQAFMAKHFPPASTYLSVNDLTGEAPAAGQPMKEAEAEVEVEVEVEVGSQSKTTQQTITTAFTLLQQYQYNTTAPFFPPFSFYTIKNLFASFIHMNTVGNSFNQFMRHIFAIPDNNVFVTLWICQCMIEANTLQTISINDTWLTTILDSIYPAFIDHNHNNLNHGGENIPMVDFWLGVLNNGTYSAQPINLIKPIQLVLPLLPYFKQQCANNPSTCPSLQPIIDGLNELSTLAKAFGIPADFDDSSVSLAVGGLLADPTIASQLPASSNAWWTGSNLNPGKLMNLYAKYAYKPFSSDINENAIDPRTYYWLRHFIYEKQKQHQALNGTQDTLSLSFITTWIQNIAENNAEFYSQHNMPFNINNVDVTVISNSLFGIFNAYFADLDRSGGMNYASWSTPLFLQTIENSVELIHYVITNNLLNGPTGRPDLILVYYPPTYDFYWFASRSLRLLQTRVNDFEKFNLNANVIQTLNTSYQLLSDALRNYAFDQLYSQAGFNQTTNEMYWDQFLGLADTNTDKNNHTYPTPHYDDRLFSTAVVLNALFDSFTTFDPDNSPSLNWIPNAVLPNNLLPTLTSACTFLNNHLVGTDYAKENTFFSGSVKGFNSLPFRYPINYALDINGTVLDPTTINFNNIVPNIGISISGVVEDEEYQQLLNNNPFGMPTPTTFAGYNVDGVGLVYWSSPAMTYSVGLLALSKCQALNM